MIEFGNPDGMRWDDERMVVVFSVFQDGNEIVCRVSRAAIDDHFGNPQSNAARLQAAKEHFDELTDKVGQKIALGTFEPDGSILLRSADWETGELKRSEGDSLHVSDKADVHLETSRPDVEVSKEARKDIPIESREEFGTPSVAQEAQTKGGQAKAETAFEARARSKAEFEARARSGTKPQYPDNVPTHIDHPALEDELGRRGFARALVARIRRVEQQGRWATFRKSEPESFWDFVVARFWELLDPFKQKTTADDVSELASNSAPFVLHIHGPWGAGKTSLLEFMRQDLQADLTRYWVVVRFNAWLHQRIGPPWWALMNEFYWQARAQLGDKDARWVRPLQWNQLWWRFGAGTAPYWLLGGALLWLGGLGALNALAAVSAGVGALLSVGRGLLLGSAWGATTALEMHRDPLRPLVRHFRNLVLGAGYPVAIFVDDLDRCDGEYVVRLLQGIQTLFHNFPVAYVVAADRHWLRASYENAYGDFKGFVGEPGRPLGYLFLEKVFEVSASVPRLPPATKRKYWARLLGIDRENIKGELDDARRKARQEMESFMTEDEILAATAEVDEDEDDPIRQQAVREAAAVRLASQDIEEHTQHTLTPFETLLEPNPRAMKRMVNAYGIRRAIDLLLGGSTDRGTLALWTIMELRWPILAEYLADNPTDVKLFFQKRPNLDRLPDNVRDLFKDGGVRQVVSGEANGKKVSDRLTPESIRACTGLHPAEPIASTMA